MPRVHSFKVPAETLPQILIVIGVALVDGLLSNVSWRLVGASRRGWRGVGRAGGAFLGILNLALGVFCLLRMLRQGPEWMFIALLVLSTVFAYRAGGATRGQYP